jgi:hypothetical protein
MTNQKPWDKNKTCRFSLRMTEWQKAHLHQIAFLQNKPVSTIVIDALTQYDSGFNQKRVNPYELTRELELLISLMNIAENNPDPEPSVVIGDVIQFIIQKWDIDMEHPVTIAICNQHYKPIHPKQPTMEVIK